MTNKKIFIIIGILLILGIAIGMFLSYLFFSAPGLHLKDIWIYIVSGLLFLPGLVAGLYCGQNTWGCASYLQYSAPIVYSLLLPLIYILGLLVYRRYRKKNIVRK